MVDENKTDVISKKKFFEFKSIRTKMIISTIMILIIGGSILTGIAAFMSIDSLTQASHGSIYGAGESSTSKLAIFMDAADDLTEILAVDPIVVSVLSRWNEGSLALGDVTEEINYLNIVIDNSSDIYFGLSVFDTKGVVVLSTNKNLIGKDYSQFLPAANQRATSNPLITQPYQALSGDPIFGSIALVSDENGKELGYLLIAFNVKGLCENVLVTPGLRGEHENFIVGPDGTIFSGVNGDYSSFLTKKFDINKLTGDITRTTGYTGFEAYIVKTPVPKTNWFIITGESVEEVDGPIMVLTMTMIGSLILVIIGGGLVALFISNSLARPIQALTDIAQRLAAGDVNVDVTYASNDEIGQLADAFRETVKNIKRNAGYVNSVAFGNVSGELVLASDRDIEGKALITMRDTLSAMVMSLDTLAQHTAEGNLSYRADASQFQGVYHDLIKTLNNVFDLIITPLQETMRLSVSYSSGDYSDRFDPDIVVKGDFVPFKNALDQIGINTSSTLLKIKNGVHEISDGTVESSGSIEDISRSVTTLAEIASKVDSLTDQNDVGLEQSLTAMNDLTHIVGEIAQRTAAVSMLAGQTSNLSYDGVKRAEMAGDGMQEIMGSFKSLSDSVSSMSGLMEEIGGIVGVISSIAEQTSLLALNAAIEAARAGDAGLGFAVVADEVKSLAQESQISAEHIGSIIGQLQKMSVEMTTGMEKAAGVMQSGNNAVNETVTIFNQMAEATLDLNKNISEVATASEEQAASVQEITASMSEVRNMVGETAKEATDAAAAAEEISASLDPIKRSIFEAARVAESIEKDVGTFKLE